YGGSCFPKDTLALVETGREADSRLGIVEAVIRANEARKARLAERVVAEMGGTASGRTIAVLGLTFKPNTDDMRDAPSLVMVPALQKHGASVRVHDPKGMPHARALLDGVAWCESPLEAAEGADAIVITTEWDIYRAMDLAALRAAMRGDLFFDFRNIYKAREVTRFGYRYFGIGRGDELGAAPADDERPAPVRLVGS
ncbi:MAG: UDP-glucose/GDP-mannose dehydrogenase family protein, partial [Rhizobiales bacterium]|nr:UDP-glucose/GDP-mannose dehydrogenase family protein [Hyphomicrobiales bacterium]